jgi:hypothetical protein
VDLNGSLHEFILADVFQLLAQQKASGKLEVRLGDRVGFMMLMQGAIVSAQEEQESVQRKLANALRALRRLPERDIEKLLATHSGSVARFCAELLSRKALSDAELTTVARCAVEDVSCSLFSWSRGTYRFDSMDLVKQQAAPGVVLPADSVVMEAMRRSDEGKRLFGQFTDETIFVATSREHGMGGIPRDLTALCQSPDTYVLSFVDGLTSIASIVERSCLCRYRILETLYRLKEANAVAPLSAKLSQSIQAAMNKSGGVDDEHRRSLALAVGGSLLAAMVVVFIGLFVFRGIFMHSKAMQSTRAKTEIEVAQAAEKLEIAKLRYRTLVGSPPKSVEELYRAGILCPDDLAALLASQKTGK